MSNTNTLPEELQRQIEQEAEGYKQQPYYKNGDPLSVAPQIYLKRGYIAGATEYASKLHLLQQEYEEHKGFYSGLFESYHNCRKEYDKLKEAKACLRGCYDAACKVIDQQEAELASLKEKAEKMADSLSFAMQTIQFADQFLEVPKPYVESWGNDYMNTIASIETALSYNSNTNQNENNENS